MTILLELPSNDGESEYVDYYDIGEGNSEAESERVRIKGKKEKLSDHSFVFKSVYKSRRRASSRSSIAVVRNYIFNVGKAVLCIDTSAPEIGWVVKSPLIVPRESPVLVYLDEDQDHLYCFSGGEDGPWLQAYNIMLDFWTCFDIKPTVSCSKLPYSLDWHAIVTNDEGKKIIVFCGMSYGDDHEQLYCCDLEKSECDIYDQDFILKFYYLINALLRNQSKQNQSQSKQNQSETVSHNDTFIALRGKPAQGGRFLYFTGEYTIYCYDLRDKSWLPSPLEGFDRSTSVLPSPILDRPIHAPVWNPMCKIVNLGGQEFCVTWVPSSCKRLYWTRFVVSTGDDGIPKASGFKTTKKICITLDTFAGRIKCLPIQPANNPWNSAGTSKGKKKKKKKSRTEKQESEDILPSTDTSGASKKKKRKIEKQESGDILSSTDISGTSDEQKIEKRVKKNVVLVKCSSTKS
ncbi:hypothetical protein ACFE04_006965 [Oxalis oulophora]